MSFGSLAVLAGTYRFNKIAAGTNWWTAAAGGPIAPGDYRTTVLDPTTSPAAVTNWATTFAGVAAL